MGVSTLKTFLCSHQRHGCRYTLMSGRRHAFATATGLTPKLQLPSNGNFNARTRRGNNHSILFSATFQPSEPSSEDPEIGRTDCFSVTLSKPLGLVLEMNEKTGNVIVAQVQEGGNAEKSGMVKEGDILVSTTGYTRTTEQVYGETRVQGGERVVRLTVRGESFDTVLAAIGSHPASIPVTLELRRPR